MIKSTATVLLVAALLTGCGGGDDDKEVTHKHPLNPQKDVHLKVPKKDTQAINNFVDSAKGGTITGKPGKSITGHGVKLQGSKGTVTGHGVNLNGKHGTITGHGKEVVPTKTVAKQPTLSKPSQPVKPIKSPQINPTLHPLVTPNKTTLALPTIQKYTAINQKFYNDDNLAGSNASTLAKITSDNVVFDAKYVDSNNIPTIDVNMEIKKGFLYVDAKQYDTNGNEKNLKFKIPSDEKVIKMLNGEDVYDPKGEKYSKIVTSTGVKVETETNFFNDIASNGTIMTADNYLQFISVTLIAQKDSLAIRFFGYNNYYNESLRGFRGDKIGLEDYLLSQPFDPLSVMRMNANTAYVPPYTIKSESNNFMITDLKKANMIKFMFKRREGGNEELKAVQYNLMNDSETKLDNQTIVLYEHEDKDARKTVM